MRSVPVPAISAGDVGVAVERSCRSLRNQHGPCARVDEMHRVRGGDRRGSSSRVDWGVGAWFTCNHTRFLHLDGE